VISRGKLSPEPLLQELLWPDQWKCTVACLLLNLTTRKQVDRVWPELFEAAPGPEELLKLSEEHLKEIIKPLGMYNVRAKRLRKLAESWGRVEHSKLPGVGVYANQSNEIFFHDNLLHGAEVNDGALTKYLDWRRKQAWKTIS